MEPLTMLMPKLKICKYVARDSVHCELDNLSATDDLKSMFKKDKLNISSRLDLEKKEEERHNQVSKI